jgi:hypothetical protein
MAREQVGFVDWPIGVVRDLVRGGLDRPPEVTQVRVGVVDCLEVTDARAVEQDGQRTGERLDVVLNVADPGPDLAGAAGLPPEPVTRGTAVS